MLIIVCRIKKCNRIYYCQNDNQVHVSYALKREYSYIMKSDILIKFGKRVREERTKNNLSQEELASKAGVHRTYIGMIERAEKNITLENIEKIANALNLKLENLFRDL
jgi:ribosome-binding protein aMBF1 (putative translation factor)